MKPDYIFEAPGLRMEAWRFGSTDELSFAGLLVEFDESVSEALRPMALEAALRHWQREVGSVRRGARADLAGWRVQADGVRIARIRLSLKEKHEADG